MKFYSFIHEENYSRESLAGALNYLWKEKDEDLEEPYKEKYHFSEEPEFEWKG